MPRKHPSRLKRINKNSRLYRLRYCLLAGACTAAIMTVVYFCFNLFPFGEMTILRMDLYHQYGPLFAELYERITRLDSMFYSWKSGGGGNFTGNFYNYLSSPWAIIVLLLGHKNMPEAIAGMIFCKAVTASFTFSYFLSKKFGKSSPLISAFGVLYANSGFFIAYYWNVMWLDAFAIFPLVILGIEYLVKHGKMRLYLLSLALTLLTNYYMGYMVCIFSVLYFLYAFFVNYGIADSFFGPLQKPKKGLGRKLKYGLDCAYNNCFINRALHFALASVGAGLLVAFALLPIYYALTNCSAVQDRFPQEIKTYFSIFDFLANHLAYLDPTIRSSGEDVLPNVYCGILPLMLVPLYIFSNRVPAKEKVLSVGFLGVMFASVYVNYLNFIWHGLHFPNDLPYRFSFMYSFLLLVLAFRALTLLKEYSKRQLIAAGAGVVFFVILVQEIGSKNFSETGVWICIAFIGVYTLALGMLQNKRYPRIAAAALILCSVCAEYTVANTNNYSMDQNKESYVGDYDNFAAIKQNLDEAHGDEAYRMELTALRARMDPCWYYYNGMSTFSSMAYEKVSNMQSKLGMFSNYINSYTYNRQTAVYNAMFSLDYIVDNASSPKAPFNDAYYKRLENKGKFTSYENLYSLPLVFPAEPELADWTFDCDNPFEAQESLFADASGVKDVFRDMTVTDVTGVMADSDYEAFGDSGCYPFAATGDTGAALSFDLTTAEDGNAYLYFKTGSDNVATITVTLPDGTSLSQNVDVKPYILDLGYLNKGDVISVYAPLRSTSAKNGYMYLYGATLDDETFRKGFDILQDGGLTDATYSETKITGKVKADKDGVLFTSINYDAGWTVYIDGQQVAPEDMLAISGALLGVNIKQGEHTVELRFVPEGLVSGVMISVATLITMLLAVSVIKTGFFDFHPKKREEEEEDEEETEETPDSAEGAIGKTEEEIVLPDEPQQPTADEAEPTDEG